MTIDTTARRSTRSGARCPGRPSLQLLTSADPSKTVAATFGIDTSTNQLRRVVLTGPFVSAANTNTSYTLVLTNYGENVSVTPPPASG